MRIINAHVHMVEPERILASSGPLVPSGISVYEHLEQSIDLVLPRSLLSQMDEAGIEKSILFAVEAPILFSSNEYVHKLCRQHPDRLTGFGNVDPTLPDAPDRLDRLVTDMGFKGLKFHPPLQDFYPNDESIFGVYEKAVALDIPIVFHVGTTPFGSRCKLSQADPLLIDDVANAFPSLRVMLTHLGTLWHHESFMVVEKHPNVFIDTAAYVYEIPKLLDLNLVKRLGTNKIIFGTDYPSPFADEPHRMRDFVDCIGGLELPDDIKNGIFCDNLQQLLHGVPAGEPPSDALSARLREKLEGSVE